MDDFIDNRRDIEKEFEESWMRMEMDFAQDILINRLESLLPVYKFMYYVNLRYHRSNDYARRLRPGQTMMTFVLSRSREYGLRNDQHRLLFNVVASEDGNIKAENSVKVTYYDGTTLEEIVVDALVNEDGQIVAEVKRLLDRLVEQPID